MPQKYYRESPLTSKVQSILFSKQIFTVEKVAQFLRRHSLRFGVVTDEINFFHYRVFSPKKFSRIRSLKTKSGIIFRIGIP